MTQGYSGLTNLQYVYIMLINWWCMSNNRSIFNLNLACSPVQYLEMRWNLSCIGLEEELKWWDLKYFHIQRLEHWVSDCKNFICFRSCCWYILVQWVCGIWAGFWSDQTSALAFAQVPTCWRGQWTVINLASLSLLYVDLPVQFIGAKQKGM